MRLVLGAPRRHARLLVPRPRRAGRGPRDRHRRGAGRGGRQLHRVQEAFAEAGAVQCGFCTPGLVVATAALLERAPGPERRRDPRGALRQPLPLHRLPEDLRRGARGGDRGDAMSTSERKLELGRVGESVRRADAIPKVDRRVRLRERPLCGRDALGPHRPQPARARADQGDRHLGAVGDARRPRRAHARGRPGREALRPRVPRPAGARLRPRPLLRRARGARRRRAPRAGAPGGRAGRASSTSELEPVVDPERALETEPIHPQRWTDGHGYHEDPRPNVVRTIVIRHGDPEAEGEVAVEGVYELGIQDQAFLGPESGLAVPDGEGGVDIYVATQWLHVDRDQVAPCLGLTPAIHERTSRRTAGRLLPSHRAGAVPLLQGVAEDFAQAPAPPAPTAPRSRQRALPLRTRPSTG